MSKLKQLYEENPEGIGFRNSKNLGSKIAKAMGMYKQNAKKNQKSQKSRYKIYQYGTKLNQSPVPNNPRHRKFMGINKVQQPY